jgi:hypothetical protein
MGGYIVERKAKLPCVDVVIGNPLPEDVKLSAPVYSQAMLDEYGRQGMIVEYVRDGELLKDRLEAVRKRGDEMLGRPR